MMRFAGVLNKATLLLVLGSGSLEAASILYDGFLIGGTPASGQYAEGAVLPSANPSLTNFSGAWSSSGTPLAGTVNSFTRTSAALSVGSLVVNGGGLVTQRTTGSSSSGISYLTRSVGPGLNFQLGQSYYFSILIRPTSFSGGDYLLGITNGAGSFGFGFDAAGKLGIWNGTGTGGYLPVVSSFVGTDGTAGGAAYATGSAYYLSGKLVISATNDNADVLSLFAPQTSSIPSSEPSVFTSYTGDIYDPARTFSNINLTTFKPGITATTATFDEMHMGTTFGDVAPVPEPASASLLCLGCVIAVGSRRRAS